MAVRLLRVWNQSRTAFHLHCDPRTCIPIGTNFTSWWVSYAYQDFTIFFFHKITIRDPWHVRANRAIAEGLRWGGLAILCDGRSSMDLIQNQKNKILVRKNSFLAGCSDSHLAIGPKFFFMNFCFDFSFAQGRRRHRRFHCHRRRHICWYPGRIQCATEMVGYLPSPNSFHVKPTFCGAAPQKTLQTQAILHLPRLKPCLVWHWIWKLAYSFD